MSKELDSIQEDLLRADAAFNATAYSRAFRRPRMTTDSGESIDEVIRKTRSALSCPQKPRCLVFQLDIPGLLDRLYSEANNYLRLIPDLSFDSYLTQSPPVSPLLISVSALLVAPWFAQKLVRRRTVRPAELK